MRRALLAIIFAIFASTTLSSVASAQGQQDFSLVNRTGYQINEIYVSSANDRNWGRDLLGDNTLAEGRQFNVRFRPSTRACNWDIKVVYDDGENSEFRGVNLCQVSRVTLYWNRRAGTTRFVTE